MTFEPLTPEGLDEAAGRLLAPGGAEDVPEEPEPAGEPEPGPEGDGAEPPPPEEPEETAAPEEPAPPAAGTPSWRFDDLDVTVDETLARQYALFEHRLKTDPAFMAAVAAAVQPPPGPGPGPGPLPGRAGPHPAGGPGLEPPPDVDLDDPTAQWMAAQVAQLSQAQQAQQQALVAQQRWIETQQADVSRSIVEQSVAAYQTAQGLSDADMAEIRHVAGTQVQLPASAATDPAGAIHQALEIARWAIPRFREAAIDAAKGQVEGDRKRQRKLAAVAGSSGSAPRTPAEPRNADERKEGLRKAVYELWQGNSVNE